jgi:uncharacterized membrane protein
MNISTCVAWCKKNWIVLLIVIVVLIVIYKYVKSKKAEVSAKKQIAFVKPSDVIKPTKQAPEKPKEDASDKAFQDGMSEDNVSGLGDVKM